MRLPLLRLATDNRQPDHIAEVIETSTTQFLAQCLEPEELNFPVMPPFGSWVKSLDEESGNKIFAVVVFGIGNSTSQFESAAAVGEWGSFFALDHRRFYHATWHLFVLAGTVLHFLAIAIYVLPAG